jgi:hypothetical protein
MSEDEINYKLMHPERLSAAEIEALIEEMKQIRGEI